MDILKPCPFCGAAPVRLILKKRLFAHNNAGVPLYRIAWSARCNACHARGPTASDIRLPVCDDSDLKEKAAQAWNRRRIIW